MAKTISLKLSFVIVFAIAMLFVAQSVFVPARAQAPGNLTAVPPVSVKSAVSVPAPTTAELEQIKKVAKALPALLVLSAENIKTILALQVNATAQLNVREQKTGVEVPVLFEKNTDSKYGDVVCGYLPDIAVNGKPAPRIAIMRNGLAAQILDIFRGEKPSIVLFDPAKYGTSFGCIKNLTAAAPVLLSMSLSFPDPIVSSMLAKSGAEIIAQAKAAAECPKNIQALVQNIEKRCAKNNACRVAGQKALRAQLQKNPKTATCDLPGFFAPVSPTTSVAPGRPEPGTPGAVPAVPPTPPSGGAPAPTIYDFGDATLGFPTLLSENGPRHRLSNRVWLGELIDGENDGLRTNLDDATGVDDEDGMIQSNPQFTLLVRTGPAVSGTVYINAWEDWNKNNRWDINANGAPGDEWIVRNQPVQVRPNTAQNVALVQPRNGPDGQPLPAAWSDPAAWVRFMVTESRIPNGNPAFVSAFNSGETEDYIGVPAPAPEHPGEPSAPTGAPAGGDKGAVGPAS